MTVHWIFDFDGTLVDSEPAIKNCFVKVIKELAPSRTHAANSAVIGPPLIQTAQVILGDEYQHLTNSFIEKFKSLYDQTGIYMTPTFPSSQETLRELKKRGDKLSIATNKRQLPTVSLLNFLNWNTYFDYVICTDSNPNIKTKFQMLQQIKQDLNQDNYYFVGDTVGDGLAANQASIPFIRANYGYGKNENWSGLNVFLEINQLYELTTLIQ